MSPLIKVCGMTEAENIRNVELQGVDTVSYTHLDAYKRQPAHI